jgi:hypothetical protein
MTENGPFATDYYRRHNSRRLEHLATLGLQIAGRRVLELGAGVGDHTSFFIDRGCVVTSVEGRAENLAILKSRFPLVTTILHDLDDDDRPDIGEFEVVYAYGFLYHLANPRRGIAAMSSWSRDLLLLETCVSFGSESAINPIVEPSDNPTQSLRGQGCRPTRRWVFEALRSEFDHVYLPRTQPWHDEFPTDWSCSVARVPLTRAIFIASHRPIESDLLVSELLVHQGRPS